ncbi:MAG: hypothetical protein J6T44_11360 [Prevotella sp.]|nr:hypothetical protein [Prevotella sp.]
MKKYFYSMLVLAVFAIGFTASDETKASKDSEEEVTEEKVREKTSEESQPKENPDIQHFVGDYIYSYFLGNTNYRIFFKISLKADGSFIWEPTNEDTKKTIELEKVVDGKDYPDGGHWVVMDTPAGKGAFLDFDCDWGKGSITYDRKVLEIKNMNGYDLKTELKYEAPKVLPKVPDSPEAMIKEFYKYVFGEKEMDDDILDTYLSSVLKKSLWTEDYDGCYEYWRFRTTAQDFNPETGDVSKINEVKSDGDGWYTVKYLDMGNEGQTRVKMANGKIVELKSDKSWESWDE